jgi:hypothetical protein
MKDNGIDKGKGGLKKLRNTRLVRILCSFPLVILDMSRHGTISLRHGKDSGLQENRIFLTLCVGCVIQFFCDIFSEIKSSKPDFC